MLQFCDYKTGKKANLEILHIHMQSKDEPTICEHSDFKSYTELGFSNHVKKVHGIKPKLIHDAETANKRCNKCGEQMKFWTLLAFVGFDWPFWP